AGNRIGQNYDPNGNSVQVTRSGPIGGPTPTDNSGSTNVLLTSTEYKYDELNRAYQQDDALFVPAGALLVRPAHLIEGPSTPLDGKISKRTMYDRNSRVVQEIQDDLSTITNAYDGVNRLISTVDPERNTTTHTYDENNNVSSTVE